MVDVAVDSVSAKAGIKTGNSIASINGTPVGGVSHEDMISMLKEAGTSVALTVTQDVHPTGTRFTLQVVTVKKEAGQGVGMSIGDGTATGMYQTVDEIFADTAAAKAGVEKDDVVLAVNGVAATNSDHDAVVAQLKAAGDELVLTIARADKTQDWAVKISTVTPLMNDGQFPSVGLGTWKAGPGEVMVGVFTAIQRGYRHIDCACDYGNEEEVGAGIRFAIDLGIVTRAELWVTSKLWCTYHAQEHVEPACQKTLTDLGLDYVDLYLIHFPISLQYVPFEQVYPPEWTVPETGAMTPVDVPLSATWAGMESLVAKGLAKNIGVSNFNCQLIGDLLTYCKVKPMVNQIEIHPHNHQDRLVAFCKWKGIVVTGFSPLGAKSYSWLDGDTQAAVMDEPVIKRIAASYSKSTAQICIRWQVQRGLTVVPKSCNPGRLTENLDVFDFELSEQDMADIKTINKDRRYNDPADFCKGMGMTEYGYPIYG